MILEFEPWMQASGALRTDVCIVGGGPVGLELAVALARGRRRVTVLEGGGRAPDPKTRRLTRLRQTGRRWPTAVAEPEGAIEPAKVRSAVAEIEPGRVLGGGSLLWNGRWRLPDPVEFEARPWVAANGWPLAWAEIAPFAEGVARACNVPALARPPGAPKAADGALGAVRPVYGYEKPPAESFAARHAAMLAAAPNVVVVLGANVTEVLPAPGGGAVRGVSVRALSGTACRVEAATVIVATGAIEAARLLLNSTRFGGCGPGNARGLVGRGLMDHASVRAGRFTPAKQAAADGLLGTPALERQGVFTRLALSAARQRELGLPNHALILGRSEDPGMMRRVFGPPGPCEAHVLVEPLPDPRCRVALDPESDELGMPIAAVHWDFGPRDEEGVALFTREMAAALARRGHGHFEIDPNVGKSAGWRGWGHAMGTVRMGASAEEGVVDRDGRVFGVQGLHVAGSAVFPAAGGGEPMLLALALARRLAHQLEG
jgi:choline dehydrogenase-like flavoprotein